MSSDWEQRYKLDVQIAKGSFGRVLAGRDLLHPSQRCGVAIKLVACTGNDVNSKDLRMILREIHCLQILDHPNILQMSDAFMAPATDNGSTLVCLVTPRYAANLAEIARTQELSMAHRKSILVSVCRGLAYMHLASIVHRDVKPQNILINADMQACVADLGFARYLPAKCASRDSAGGMGPRTRSTPTLRPNSLIASEWSEYVITRWVRCPSTFPAPLCPMRPTMASTSAR